MRHRWQTRRQSGRWGTGSDRGQDQTGSKLIIIWNSLYETAREMPQNLVLTQDRRTARWLCSSVTEDRDQCRVGAALLRSAARATHAHPGPTSCALSRSQCAFLLLSFWRWSIFLHCAGSRAVSRECELALKAPRSEQSNAGVKTH